MHVGQGAWRTAAAYRHCQETGQLLDATGHHVLRHLLKVVSAPEGQFCTMENASLQNHADSVWIIKDTHMQ